MPHIITKLNGKPCVWIKLTYEGAAEAGASADESYRLINQLITNPDDVLHAPTINEKDCDYLQRLAYAASITAPTIVAPDALAETIYHPSTEDPLFERVRRAFGRVYMDIGYMDTDNRVGILLHRGRKATIVNEKTISLTHDQFKSSLMPYDRVSISFMDLKTPELSVSLGTLSGVMMHHDNFALELENLFFQEINPRLTDPLFRNERDKRIFMRKEEYKFRYLNFKSIPMKQVWPVIALAENLFIHNKKAREETDYILRHGNEIMAKKSYDNHDIINLMIYQKFPWLQAHCHYQNHMCPGRVSSLRLRPIPHHVTEIPLFLSNPLERVSIMRHIRKQCDDDTRRLIDAMIRNPDNKEHHDPSDIPAHALQALYKIVSNLALSMRPEKTYASCYDISLSDFKKDMEIAAYSYDHAMRMRKLNKKVDQILHRKSRFKLIDRPPVLHRLS